jgi:hypothetical protein
MEICGISKQYGHDNTGGFVSFALSKARARELRTLFSVHKTYKCPLFASREHPSLIAAPFKPPERNEIFEPISPNYP